MNKVKIIQTRYNGTRTKVLETNVVDTFKTADDASDYLEKRGYKWDDVAGGYVQGNAVQAPCRIEVPVDLGLFDIRSFV